MKEKITNNQISAPYVFDTDLEREILCFLFKIKDTGDAFFLLKPDCFYAEEHRFIYEKIFTLYNQNKEIDLITIRTICTKEELEKYWSYLVLIATKGTSPYNIDSKIKVLVELSIKRKLKDVFLNLVSMCDDKLSDLVDLTEYGEKELYNAILSIDCEKAKHLKDIAPEYLLDLQKAIENKGELTGVETGFAELNCMMLGWQPSDLIIIAARPSMGKTAFVISMLSNIAKNGKKVALFSLEMSAKQLFGRFVQQDCDIPSEFIKIGNLTDDQITQVYNIVGDVSKYPVLIDDTSSLTVAQLRSRIRKLKIKFGIELVVIDYLQLICPTNSNIMREQQIAEMTRSLKTLAKQIDIPIVVLSQLNRQLEQRVGQEKRPQLSDLRESGSIEQDADVVIFIHRPEKYKIPEVELEGQTISSAGIAEIIIAKHRNGATSDFLLNFDATRTRFSDFTELDKFNRLNNS